MGSGVGSAEAAADEAEDVVSLGLRPGLVFLFGGAGGGEGAPSSFSAAASFSFSSCFGIDDWGGSSVFSSGMGCGVLRMLS
jgi:hypothetical protein